MINETAYYNPVGTAVHRTRTALNDERIRSLVPAVFAERPAESVSDRYGMVSSLDVVNAMRDSGWEVTQARTTGTRNGDYSTGKHELRFTPREALQSNDSVMRVGDAMIELVMTNSLNATSAFCFEGGIYRFVCANGMILCDEMFASIHVRHTKANIEGLLDTTVQLAENAESIGNEIDRFRSVELSPGAQQAFAEAALMVRYDLDADEIEAKSPVSPTKLLEARRVEDRGDDLWSTFNRVQENVTRGGQKDFKLVESDDGSRKRARKTRPVTAIDKDQKLQKALMHLAKATADNLS